MNKRSVKEEIHLLKDDLSVLEANFSTLQASLLEEGIIKYKEFEKDSQEMLRYMKQVGQDCELECKSKITYTDIKSHFVKNELKKTSWIGRMYIDDLMKIEMLISGRTFGLPTGYIRTHLKDRYPKQWKAIFLELDPKGYKKEVGLDQKQRKKELQIEKKFNKEVEEDELRDKEAWKRAGGKILAGE